MPAPLEGRWGLRCPSWVPVPSWVFLVHDTNQRKKQSYLLPRELFSHGASFHKGDARKGARQRSQAGGGRAGGAGTRQGGWLITTGRCSAADRAVCRRGDPGPLMVASLCVV